MSEPQLVPLSQLRQFLAGTSAGEFRGCGQDADRHRHIESVLRRFGDGQLKRLEKGGGATWCAPRDTPANSSPG